MSLRVIGLTNDNMKARGKKSLAQQRREKADEAMPSVKKLVRKYGRTAIANCLNKLREYEKQSARLAGLKKEVAKLEKDLA